MDNLEIFLNTSIEWEEIILPIAISFFTFQQIAYLVDVYNNNIEGGVNGNNPTSTQENSDPAVLNGNGQGRPGSGYCGKNANAVGVMPEHIKRKIKTYLIK